MIRSFIFVLLALFATQQAAAQDIQAILDQITNGAGGQGGGIGDLISGLLGGSNLNDLVNAAQKCDSANLDALYADCEKAEKTDKNPCPAACAKVLQELENNCKELAPTLGTALSFCGGNPTGPTTNSPSPKAPTTVTNSTTGQVVDSTDYQQQENDYEDMAMAPGMAPNMDGDYMDFGNMTMPGIPPACLQFYTSTEFEQKTEQCDNEKQADPTKCPAVCIDLANSIPKECIEASMEMAKEMNLTGIIASVAANMTTEETNDPCAKAMAGTPAAQVAENVSAQAPGAAPGSSAPTSGASLLLALLSIIAAVILA